MANAGQRTGEFVLDEQIGRGTFGEVWRARHHVWNDQVVAVKIPTDARYLIDLQREGVAVRGLAHANIVRAINFDPFADPPYLVMEYVHGESLRAILEKERRLSPAAALGILRPIVQALAFAHKQGVVHRDVKPENILVGFDAWSVDGHLIDETKVKLTDFGFAETVTAPRDSIVFTEDLAQRRRLGGSPGYMAPEQASDRYQGELDGRADIYSCGAILFEMLTGEMPVGTELPSELNPDVPPSVDSAFERSYARLESRFESADEFLSSLAIGAPFCADKLKVVVKDDRLLFGEWLAVSFHRTLRVPDDGNTYPLPPSLGRIPVHRVADYADRVPPEWNEHGGVFIPLYQREAMWIHFEGSLEEPHAVKVAVGKVNALTGAQWDEDLHLDPQDYLSCPHQPWLDGIDQGDGYVRQFVATPLGQGYTVEGQLTGKEEIGGIQLKVFPRTLRAVRDDETLAADLGCHREMGLAAGGRIVQRIVRDHLGVSSWSTSRYGRIFVHIVNSEVYRHITGRRPPPTAIKAAVYTACGYPWYRHYREDDGTFVAIARFLRRFRPQLSTSEIALKTVKSIKKIDEEKGLPPRPEDNTFSVASSQIRPTTTEQNVVTDGKW